MNHFWHFAKQMFDYPRLMFITLASALLDALCNFAGLGALLMVVSVLLQEGRTVQDLATQYLSDERVQNWIGDQTALLQHLPDDKFYGFALLVGTILAFAMIGSVFRFIYQYTAITISFRTVMKARKNAFQRLVHLPMHTLQDSGTADNLSRIVRDCGGIARGLNAVLGKAIRDILMGMSAMVMAFLVNWELTVIFLLAMPVLAVLIRKFGKRIRRASKAAMAQYGRMIAAIQESLQAIRVVKVHQAEGYERRRFNVINRRVWKEEMRARTARALSSPVIELVAILGIGMVAIAAAWIVYRTDNANPTDLVKVIAMLGMAGAAFRPLANLNNDLQEAAAAATRIHEILHIDVEPNTREHGRAQAKQLPRHTQSVSLDGVVFQYPSAQTPALKGVSLHVQQGQTCAIVGGNGSGKSTILGLIPRLYEPTGGRVLIDGVDIRQCSLKSVRGQMAMVTQDTVLFDGTIADNLTYGSRHADAQRMIEASKRAHAHEFISQLPDGYDTSIGEWGSRLSGGQRQRIAIARAILRDPAILILDEATSQIDSESEAKITVALNELMKGRTTFVVAHRLSTVVNADMIVVLAAGQIVDQGTHSELIDRCNIYQQLARTQLQANMV